MHFWNTTTNSIVSARIIDDILDRVPGLQSSDLLPVDALPPLDGSSPVISGGRVTGWTPPRAALEELVWSKIKSERARRWDLPITVSGLGSFDVVGDAWKNLSGAIGLARSGSVPVAGIDWKTSDNLTVTLSSADLLTIESAEFIKRSIMFARAEALKLELPSLSDSDLLSYNVAARWEI